MKRLLLAVLMCLNLAKAQNPPNVVVMVQSVGSVLPMLCNNGDIFYIVSTYVTYRCGPINTWSLFSAPASGTLLIAGGTAILGTSAISSASCATVVSVAATGVLATDVVLAGFNSDPTAVTGYVPLTTGMLTIITYPGIGTANFKVCNNTASSVTPGAITLNWKVVR